VSGTLERPFFLQLGRAPATWKKRHKVESQTPSHTVRTYSQPNIRRMTLILFSNDFDNAEPRMGRTWYRKPYPMAKPIALSHGEAYSLGKKMRHAFNFLRLLLGGPFCMGVTLRRKYRAHTDKPHRILGVSHRNLIPATCNL